MKYLVVVSFFLLSLISVNAQDVETSSLDWLTSLEKAEKIAQKSNKPILMYLTGSDWCAPCKGLKKDFFESSEFAKRAENFVLLMIDRPRRIDILTAEQFEYNKKIVAKYNREGAFPKIIIFNSSGSEIGKLSGYSSYNTYKDTSHHYAFVDKYSSRNN